MTELLERAVEAIKRMAPAEQDSIAQVILSLAEGVALDRIEPEHPPFVLEGLAQTENGDFATDEEIEKAFRAFDR